MFSGNIASDSKACPAGTGPAHPWRGEGDGVGIACFARGAAYRRRGLIRERLRLCCGGRKRLHIDLSLWGRV